MEPTQEPILPVTPTPEPSVVQSPPPGNKPSVNRLRLIIIGAIVLLLVVGIPVSAMFLGKKAPEPVQKIAVATPTPTSDPMANWKTYTNKKHSFSIMYPSDFDAGVWPWYGATPTQEELKSLDTISIGKGSIGKDGVLVSISINPTDSAGKPMACTSNDSCLAKEIADIKLPNVRYLTKMLDGQKIKGLLLLDNKSSRFIFPDKGKIVEVEVTIYGDYTPELERQIDEILSTFKFLDASQAGQAFEIPELGIKLTLPDSIKDLIYTYDPKVGAAYFSTKRLEAGGSYCVSKDGPIGAIGKILKSDAAKNEGAPESLSILEAGVKANPPTAKDFGIYFVNYSSPQATCSDAKSVQAMQTSQISALKRAFPTVELTQ